MEKTDLPERTLLKDPDIHESVFVAPGAHVLGDVRIAKDASVWYNAVLRGDINYISIGERTNVQDGCIIHLENDLPCEIGPDCTIGHGAILHGCIIEEGCLIGMGATVLSGAVIGKGSVIAAGAVVVGHRNIDPFTLMAGVPATRFRTMPPETYDKHLQWAEKYVKLSKLHKAKYGK